MAKFREIAVLGAALWLMQMVSPFAAVPLALVLFLAGLFTLVTGRGISRLKRRWQGLGLAVVSILFAINASTIYVGQREERWAGLRVTDPDAYLAELAPIDKDRWLRELLELRPEVYQAEIARRAREAEEAAVHLADEAEAKRVEAEARRVAEEAEATQREQDTAARRAEAEVRRAAEAEEARLAACDGNEAAAYVMIQTDVRSGLKAPSTARFPAGSRGRTQYLGDCVYAVQGHFDAQNGFGAMIRGTFSGTIHYFPENRRWQTLTLDIQG